MSRFTHINEAFVCEVCGHMVPPRKKSCRNHCPFCLSSKHVDLFPGDRAADCGGILRAQGYRMSRAKGLVLRFVCQTCGEVRTNVAALDGEPTPDDYEKILTLH